MDQFRILNVNDHAPSRYMVSRWLRQAGFEVDEARDGAAARARARREPQPDLVVLDVNLPDTDGYEVCRQLKADPATEHIKVLQTSATHVSSQRRVRGLESGADGYLAQPFESDELVATVRSLMRLQHAEQELRVRAERLIELDRRKDEFLAMMAHELRNPLGAASNALAVLEGYDHRDDEEADSQRILRRQIHSLAQIIDDLLDLSRVRRGHVRLRREVFDLCGLLERVAGDVGRRYAEPKGQTIRIDLCESPLWVDGDATRLEQVFVNLLENASKYTPAGGEIWLCATAEVVDDDAMARVQVIDSGVGMSEQELQEVFDLFLQGEQSLARTTGGLGIGLTIVQNLVDLHGGAVTAHSDGPGQGSVFDVTLPITAAPRPEAPATRPQVEISDDAPTKVLLIEDDEASRRMLTRLLERWGYEVTAAADGEEGLGAAAEQRPHLAIVDVGLPKIDGFEVARRLRAADGGEEIRLVALTGYGSRKTREMAESSGFDAHLTKPADPQRLRSLLGVLVGG